MTAREILARLEALGDAEIARNLQRFFQTGPGQYGEGDVFLGIKVPPLRKLAREYRDLPLGEAEKLLHSPYHEARLLALLILVGVFACGDEDARKAVYDLYLANTARVNNWDLVDTSAGPIVGGYLAERDREPLYRLARSAGLWERRIAIVGTFPFIRLGDFADTLKLAGLLLRDREDLIHKAAGWMLREVGKRDPAVLLPSGGPVSGRALPGDAPDHAAVRRRAAPRAQEAAVPEGGSGLGWSSKPPKTVILGSPSSVLSRSTLPFPPAQPDRIQ